MSSPTNLADGPEASVSLRSAQAFAMGTALCGAPADAADLERRFGLSDGFQISAMLRAAKALGLRARYVTDGKLSLAQVRPPAIARDHAGTHFLLARVITSTDGDVERVLVQYPGARPEVLDRNSFMDRWDGSLVLLRRQYALPGQTGAFGISWFVGAVMRYRRILGEVLVVSLALQLLGLATPLFFQVVVDKVLVQQTLSTLDVIAVGLGLAMVFEAVMGGLRAYVFAHTTNRIDVELGARVFHHLVHLPLAYFGIRRVGDSVARVRELENIRQFLTGNSLTLVLDVTFATIFLAVIYIYSTMLGLVTTVAVPFYILISVVSTGPLRRRIQEKFRRGAENQSFLFETVAGMETVKAMAVEPFVQRKWEEQLAGYVRAAFRVTSFAVVSTQAAQLVSRAVTLLILYVGARLVMQGKITVGELIAVNMLAGQITNPVLRLAQVWQDFQQVQISVDRVGDIMNAAAEPSRAAGAATPPTLRGDIAFEGVIFRYHPQAQPAINDLSLAVPRGQILGVVGPSGSGKSTLTRLVQRLHTPDAGRVFVDGLDISLVDPAWLRRQIGVVLQESVLFNATVRENIALANPSLSIDQVMAAARLAGAHDFIAGMSEGYDSLIGERGATLSGGQRQRIAIARALATNPRILILDEATSALDLESEQAIQINMRGISRGRTVIIVAHRLSALRSADRVVTIENGRVVEDGTPAELLQANGRFARLYAAQTLRFGVAANAAAHG